MELLILGSKGQLGKEWVDFCRKERIRFEGFGSKELDITDADKLNSVIEKNKPTSIINCAAYTKVDQAEDDIVNASLINNEAVKTLANICKQRNIKLVHYSTDYVFNGSAEDRVNFPEGYDELTKTDPINVYGKTKREGELQILESGCKHLILRVSWLCGKYGNNFVKTMIRLGSEKEELNIVNDQFGSPTFAHLVVEHSMELLRKDMEGFFHVGSLGITTWYEFAKEIFDISSLPVKVNPVNSSEFPTRAKRPLFSKLSTQKISTINTINLKSWRVGLQELMNMIKE